MMRTCNSRSSGVNMTIQFYRSLALIIALAAIAGAALAGRKLIAIEKIDPVKFDPEKSRTAPIVTMRPECRVSGRLTCSDLARRNRALGWTNVYLNLDGNRAFGCQSEEQTFHFFVPAGEFTLDAYGTHIHHVETKIHVKPGQRELTLEPIDLPATRLALLEGMPAPELIGV